MTDGLFNAKEANLHDIIPPFVLRVMALSHWCRAPSSLSFVFLCRNYLMRMAIPQSPSVSASLSVELYLD